MMAAAAMTPVWTTGWPVICSANGRAGEPKPLGMKGVKLAASKAGRAMATKAIRATILMTTRMAFSVALSRVPSSSRPVTTAMMKTAGRLISPPSTCGPAASMAGSSTPIPARKPTA